MKHNAPLLVFLGVTIGCGGVGPEQVAEQAQACASEDIITNDLFVTVASGATLHVVEKYTASGLLDHHGRRHAVLMLPATLVTNLIWNANVPGRPEFNGLERAAKAGFISYTLDYEGYGTSSHPADGKSVNTARLAQDAGELVRWIRHRRNVSKVDLIGSSLGSTVAVVLGSTQSPVPRGWIGHVVLTANVYKNVTPLMAQFFFNPGLLQFLNTVPNGYADTDPSQYGLVLVAADPAAQGYCFQNCPGHYAVGPTLAGFQLPIIEASTGRAPMLQFWGNQDLITPLSDAQQFQAEYGGSHTLVILNGGAHVPQWESVRDQFWADTFAFLDDNGGDDDDDNESLWAGQPDGAPRRRPVSLERSERKPGFHVLTLPATWGSADRAKEQAHDVD